MRTQNAIKNISMSIFSQIIIILLGFLSRKIFIDSLGTEYLGVNGLLTNVLSMMVLIEGGIGISITYNLYKPLADNDQSKIIALVQLYKKAYSILALIVFGISILLYPFLGNMMKDGQSISNLTIVYAIFVAKNMVSYITAYKWALINADQKGYLLTRNNLIFQILSTISKMAILMITQNYLLYLIIELVIYTMQVLWNGKIVNQRYPFIRTKKKYKLDDDVKNNIIQNVKAMFLHNIGGYCVYGTDNILISSMVSVKAVGLYSNYTLVIGQLSALLSPILSGIGAGVGNLIATENENKTYDIFKVTYFINFWIYSFACIFLYNLLEPFIEWCFGKGLLLDNFTFLFILINFYLNGMRTSISTFKSKAGLFIQDKYIPVVEGIINLVSSIILVQYFGLVGVFMGTTISTITIQLWNQPRIVYREIFKKPLREYFEKYLIYIVVTLMVGGITTMICNNLVQGADFISLVIRGVICLIIPNSVYFIIFYNTEEIRYLLNILYSFLKQIKFKTILRKDY